MRTTRRTGFLLAAGITIAAVSLAMMAGWPGGQGVGGQPVAVAVVGGRAAAGAVPVVVATPVIAEQPAADSVTAHRDMTMVRALAGRGPQEQGVLVAAMAHQPRDVAKAAPFEQSMQAALDRIPALAGGGEPIRVTCVATTCEATGAAAPGQSVAAVQAALRDRGLEQAMVDHGYTPGPATVADTGGGRIGFVLYLNNEM